MSLFKRYNLYNDIFGPFQSYFSLVVFIFYIFIFDVYFKVLAIFVYASVIL